MWVNEVCRTVLDRHTDPAEHEKFYKILCDIACNVFRVNRKMLPLDFYANQFFYGLPESEMQYNEIIDEKKLTSLLQDTMLEYNKQNPQEQISVIIFNSIIEKTLKINRSIQNPCANTILIADPGSGANELCKMAIKLSGASDNQLFANDSELLEDWRGHLRGIIQRVGVETKSRAVLHMIERDFIPGVIETINGFAAHGELFQLYSVEELDSLLNQVRYKTFSTNNRGKERTEAQTIEEIREQIHQNLHLLIQLTPRSKVLLLQMRDVPHLINSSTLIFFGEWSDSGFQFIARKHLATNSEECTLKFKNSESIVKVMIEMYHDTYKASQSYYQETDHYIYTSPQTFEMFVQTFKRVFQKRSIKLIKHRDRFRIGLEGIKRTQAFTEEKQEELSKISPELVQKQRDLEALIDKLDVQKHEIQKEITLALSIEDEMVYCLNEAKIIQRQCDKVMREAVPVFKEAVEGLLQITKQEIDELRSIITPLRAILVLMTAVCLILGEKPTLVSSKKTGFQVQPCYWTTAISSKVLGDRHLISRMQNIDPTQIEDDTMRKLEELIETGDISPDKVSRATCSTRGIFSWVMAVRNYFYVYRTSEPLRNKLILSDIQLKEYQNRKAENEARLRELELRLKELKNVHSEKEDVVKFFQKDLEEVFLIKSKAARLLNELAGEKQKWMVCEEVANQNIENLEGDSLVSAAMVCFLAPFTQKTRDFLYNKWLVKIADNLINITRKLNFNSMFSDPLKIKGWLDNGLPNDSYSIQNAIILKNTQMQPILIDPQTQANKWLRNELKDVKILNMQTSRFLQELKMCIKFGSTIVIENVDQTVSSKLYPLFLFEKLKNEGVRKLNMSIMMDQTVTQIDPSFKMYITSVHKCPDFGADLSLLANFINFSVTIEAFEAQILALLLSELETEQDAKQRIFRRQALVWIKRLKTIEDDILEELKKPQPLDMLIKKEFLIEKLMESRTVTKQTGKTLLEINNAMKLLMQTSKMYKPVSQRAAKFFFVANDLLKLNPMYQFTHEWFIGFFSKLVSNTHINDQSKHKKEESIRIMLAEFVRLFFDQVCQTLFDRDKLLFSFLLAYKELEVEFKIDKRQVEFFIKGALQQEDEIFHPKNLQDVAKDEEQIREQQKIDAQVKKRRQKIAPWINDAQWKALDKLSQIPPFNQPNLTNRYTCLSIHIENNPEQWLHYINGSQFLDYTMARFTTKDEDGNSLHSSDTEISRPSVSNSSISKKDNKQSKESNSLSREEEDSNSIASVNESSFSSDSVSQSSSTVSKNNTKNVTTRVKFKNEDESDEKIFRNPRRRGIKGFSTQQIKRVNTQRFLDLGVPGGYERFNYEDAIRQGMHTLQLEQEVKQRIAEGLRKMLIKGQSIEKTRQQKELDDIFALDGGDSQYTSEQETSKAVSRQMSDSDDEANNQIEDVDEAFEDFRKNNVEEDTKIALAIIQGIAEYTEFKVQKQKKLTKRQMMKQYVINSHMVRLCIIRCFYPQKLYHEIKSFISYFLGRRFTGQPDFEFNKILKQTNKKTPILLMLGPNVNAYTELTNLKKSMPLTASDSALVYQPLGQIPAERITKTIIRSACNGNWLLLDNLQLSIEIIANLQKFLENMQTFGKQMKNKLLKKAKLELKDSLQNIKEDTNIEGDSNLAMELMLLQQSIINDTNDTNSKGKPIPQDETVMNDETENEKSRSVSLVLANKIKSILRTKMIEARLSIIRELDEYVNQKKIADEKSEIYELSNEEKMLQEMVFPEKLAFPVNKKFRLWISVIPVPNFPANFARRCLKISLELPVTIKASSMKSFGIVPNKEVEEVTRNSREYKRMLYAITIMHSVINAREKYGSFGWTQPYHFSPNDLQISLKMLAEICQKVAPGQNFPMKLMRYLVSDLNYGGKLTDQGDQILLRAQVKTFIHPRVFEDASIATRSRYERVIGALDEHIPDQVYDLTDCQADPLRQPGLDGAKGFFVEDGSKQRHYMMPVNIDCVRTMKEHVRDFFPLEDMPEIFGLHHNATIKATTDMASEIMHRTYIYQFVVKRPKQPPLTQVQSNRRNTMIYEFFRSKIKELIYNVPKVIPHELYEEQIPIERDKPFNTLLTKEIQRYNNLITKISENLENTLAAMEGLRQHSNETESAFDYIQQELTPPEWIFYSYPCPTSLPRFIENLNERMVYIRELLELASDDQFLIRNFWMPGFFNPRNLLSTLMQEVARKQRISIEKLTISFRIMGADENMFPQIKAEGTNSYYVNGLVLFGAKWDEHEQTIMDCDKDTEAIGTNLPLLHLMVETQDLEGQNSSMDEIDRDCLNTEDYQRNLLKGTHYFCPMFVNFAQNRQITNQQAEGQMITTVPIPVKYRKPKFWIKRNICILCYNERN